MRANEDELRGLMISGLDGNAADHAALLRLLVPLLRSFYRRRASGGDDDIEDLVQETLIAVHTRRATYDRDRAFTAWLFAIARYKMVDHFRRGTPACSRSTAWKTILVAEGFEDASGARLDVDDLLGTLPPKQAQMIRETRIEGLSIAEAAEAERHRRIRRQGIGASRPQSADGADPGRRPMNTEDLIARLSHDVPPVPRHAVGRRLAAGILLGRAGVRRGWSCWRWASGPILTSRCTASRSG